MKDGSGDEHLEENGEAGGEGPGEGGGEGKVPTAQSSLADAEAPSPMAARTLDSGSIARRRISSALNAACRASASGAVRATLQCASS